MDADIISLKFRAGGCTEASSLKGLNEKASSQHFSPNARMEIKWSNEISDFCKNRRQAEEDIKKDIKRADNVYLRYL
jgi:hypothetical protein